MTVRAWLPDSALPNGGSFWAGEVVDDIKFEDGAIGVLLHDTGGVIAKVPPDQCFEVSA